MKSVKEDIQRITNFVDKKTPSYSYLKLFNPNKFGENNV